MRPICLAVLAALALAPAARAEPVEEATSALGACLNAVIEGAPVGDIDGDDVFIRRGKDPVSCTVTVTAGQPVVVKDAVLKVIAARPEGLAPARSRWAPGAYASHEAFCNLPSRRNFMTFVSTGRPGARIVLTATVVEVPQRDIRCDRDEGLQTMAAPKPADSPGPR